MDIRSLTLSELTEYVLDKGYPKFRAKQIYEWCHVKLVRDASEMTNLPMNIREEIAESLEPSEIVERFESEVDGTNKFVFRLYDGNVIESVFMPYKHGNSVCISSQAGCRMGCRFCASTLLGLSRNLTAAEMLDQIYAITRVTGQRVSNVVVMGTGEPLDNYDNLCKFIRMISDENGLNIARDDRELVIKLKKIIFWLSLQEDINYPISKGKLGRKHPLFRYAEALIVAQREGDDVDELLRPVYTNAESPRPHEIQLFDTTGITAPQYYINEKNKRR